MRRGNGTTGLRLLAMAALGVLLGACGRPQAAELYPQLQEHTGRLLQDVAFRNPAPFPEDSLRAIAEAEPTRCELVPILFPFCVPGTDWGLRVRRLDPEVVGRDVARLTALYRQSGFFGTVVVPEVEELEPGDGAVRLAYNIEAGPAIIVDTVVVEGTEGIADPDSLAAVLRLRPGDRFELPRLLASAETVLDALRDRGHAYGEVLRNYAVDTERHRATAWLVAIPGPRVTVDTLLVHGLDALGPRTIRRQLTFEEGDLLVMRRLRESQRNLYDLDLIQFGSVALAPDSLQLAPEDSASATVLVQVTEGAEYQVEALAGFGTQDCIRTGAQWVDRSFIRGARRLTLSGSVSRIASRLCEAPDTLFGGGLDYRLNAEFVQPYFVNHRNRLGVTAFVERQTQPGLYRRTAQGARLSLTHRVGSREALSAAVDVEHRETNAVPALYCYAFAICTPEDIRALAEPRWRNAVGASWYRDRGNRPVSPTDGHSIRVSGLWATPLLASDYDFLRGNLEIAVYRTLRPRWVGAGYFRLGSFLTRASIGADDFVPPEERFYAGGANSVRGYPRNQLGPGVWLYTGPEVPDSVHGGLPVQFFPTGGTSLAVVSAETRFPAPWLGHLVRMAAFVDAGTVGLEPLWEAESQWRVTPGAGVRIETPVGPARIDLAYDPHPPVRGPLVVAESGGLVRVADGFRPDPPSFWRRLQLHIAVGQAF